MPKAIESNLPAYIKDVVKKKKGAKVFYDVLINTNIRPVSQQKWSDKLDVSRENGFWKHIYNSLLKKPKMQDYNGLK